MAKNSVVRTRVRALNVALPGPRKGSGNQPEGVGIYEPGSRRLTVRLRKENKLLIPDPEGVR